MLLPPVYPGFVENKFAWGCNILVVFLNTRIKNGSIIVYCMRCAIVCIHVQNCDDHSQFPNASQCHKKHPQQSYCGKIARNILVAKNCQSKAIICNRLKNTVVQFKTTWEYKILLILPSQNAYDCIKHYSQHYKR